MVAATPAWRLQGIVGEGKGVGIGVGTLGIGMGDNEGREMIAVVELNHRPPGEMRPRDMWSTNRVFGLF